MENLWVAIGLTLFAGMATGIGSILAFMTSRTNYRALSVGTGFSAGVMLYVSFVEIFSEKGANALVEYYGYTQGHWINVISFFSGIAIIGTIDLMIPKFENPHEVHKEKEFELLHSDDASEEAIESMKRSKKLMRMGLFTALAIAIHNFPEGLATFLSALEDPKIGIPIAIAIALHNIPEGVSVSIPIFYATGNRKKAFIYSFLSGLAEPVGALIGFGILYYFMGAESGVIPSNIMGILFSIVAGIMVYISLDELLPTSRAYCKGHDSIIGLILGMLIMALSLLLFK